MTFCKNNLKALRSDSSFCKIYYFRETNLFQKQIKSNTDIEYQQKAPSEYYSLAHLGM